MKTDDLKNLIQKLINKNLSGRHLYIWNSNPDILYSFIPKNALDDMDISQISLQLKINDTNDDKEIKKMLEHVLDAELSKWYQTGKSLLIISSLYLLIRYSISLNIFYNYLSDNKVIILLVQNYYYPDRLPDYIEYNSEYVLNKIREMIGEDKIVET